jgi:hypothetical protein
LRHTDGNIRIRLDHRQLQAALKYHCAPKSLANKHVSLDPQKNKAALNLTAAKSLETNTPGSILTGTWQPRRFWICRKNKAALRYNYCENSATTKSNCTPKSVANKHIRRHPQTAPNSNCTPISLENKHIRLHPQKNKAALNSNWPEIFKTNTSGSILRKTT